MRNYAQYPNDRDWILYLERRVSEQEMILRNQDRERQALLNTIREKWGIYYNAQTDQLSDLTVVHSIR